MKKILFASAFALIGTFAMANEVEETVESTSAVTMVCVPLTIDCGGGRTASGDVCGNTTAELVEASWVAAGAICG